MVTYLYWIVVFVLVIAATYVIGAKLGKWKIGLTVGVIILALSWGSYYFRFQQIFVKRYGGVMTILVPKGQHHLGATWKDDNLWIENYDPKSNSCIFSEYSKGNLLQGQVTLKNCNPMLPAAIPPATTE